mgnify:FL=1
MGTERFLQCFIDADRTCGPDCMAYQLQIPEGQDYQGESQWAHCLVLVSAHRVGKHAVILANIADGVAKKWKATSADAARAAQVPPPGVK